MPIKRRQFVKYLPLGTILPFHIQNQMQNLSSNTRLKKNNIDKLYDEAIVVDGIIIARGWNEDSFTALKKSGYTGFNASLDSFSFNRALISLNEWQKRIKNNPDKLIYATSA